MRELYQTEHSAPNKKGPAADQLSWPYSGAGYKTVRRLLRANAGRSWVSLWIYGHNAKHAAVAFVDDVEEAVGGEAHVADTREAANEALFV